MEEQGEEAEEGEEGGEGEEAEDDRDGVYQSTVSVHSSSTAAAYFSLFFFPRSSFCLLHCTVMCVG